MVELFSVIEQSILGASRSPFSGLTFAGMLAGLIALMSSSFDSLGRAVDYRGDVPFWKPGKDLWTQRQLERLTDFIGRGEGDWSKLARTLAAVIPIAALGIAFYGEDSFRNLGILDAARFGGTSP